MEVPPTPRPATPHQSLALDHDKKMGLGWQGMAGPTRFGQAGPSTEYLTPPEDTGLHHSRMRRTGRSLVPLVHETALQVRLNREDPRRSRSPGFLLTIGISPNTLPDPEDDISFAISCDITDHSVDTEACIQTYSP